MNASFFLYHLVLIHEPANEIDSGDFFCKLFFTSYMQFNSKVTV